MTNHEPTTILLVEDDPAHARLIELNLRRGGIENKIIHLNNGKTAAELLFGEGRYKGHPHPDPMLLLLDLNMPGINGIQILERIKSTEITRHIPVIIITTADNPKEIYYCYQLGCNVYITKPVAYDKFASVVQQVGHFIQLIQTPKLEKINP